FSFYLMLVLVHLFFLHYFFFDSSSLLFFLFFSSCFCAHRFLLSFPTRRSSDLCYFFYLLERIVVDIFFVMQMAVFKCSRMRGCFIYSSNCKNVRCMYYVNSYNSNSEEGC